MIARIEREHHSFDEIDDEHKPRQGAFVVGGKPPITSRVIGQREGEGEWMYNLRRADQLVACY